VRYSDGAGTHRSEECGALYNEAFEPVTPLRGAQVNARALASTHTSRGTHLVQTFNITARNTVTGEAERLAGEFDDAEWGQLMRFLDRSFRLARCGIVWTQHDLKFGMSAKVGEPTTFTATLPPERDIAEFLHAMRPFVLKGEPTSFLHVRNILARRLTLASVREHLDQLRERYSGKHIPFAVQFNDITLTSEEALAKWLNAFEYHQDSDKQEELEAMFRVFPEDSARALFIYHMLQRASAVGKLGALIDGLVKADGTERPMRL
jgi:hypothetical protein